MSTSKSWGVNGHTTRYISPVSVVSQCKLVSGWGLRKQRSAPPYGPRGVEGLYFFLQYPQLLLISNNNNNNNTLSIAVDVKLNNNSKCDVHSVLLFGVHVREKVLNCALLNSAMLWLCTSLCFSFFVVFSGHVQSDSACVGCCHGSNQPAGNPCTEKSWWVQRLRTTGSVSSQSGVYHSAASHNI